MRPLEELKISKGVCPAVREDAIRRLEEVVGYKLPAAYVELIKYRNGGHPEVDTFSKEEGEWNIDNFFFIGGEDSSTDTDSVLWNYRNQWPEAATSMLPFACDGFDNLFCLDLAYGEKAPVVIWLHDSTVEGAYHLADSFEEFIDGLHENPYDI